MNRLLNIFTLIPDKHDTGKRSLNRQLKNPQKHKQDFGKYAKFDLKIKL